MSWWQHSTSCSSYNSSLDYLLILTLFNFRIYYLHSSQFCFMFRHIQVKTIFGSNYLISSLFCLNILNIKTVVFCTYTFLLKIFELDILRWRLLNWVWKHQSIVVLNILIILIRQLLNIVDSILIWSIVIWGCV